VPDLQGETMSEKNLDVVCIGSAIVDVIATADEAFLDRHGMVKGSMGLLFDETVVRALYDDMPAAVETSGGSAANTAAGLASLGSRVGFIGKVADDLLGEVFTHDLRATGVEFAPLTPGRVDGPATARCLILVTEDAERTMNTFLGISALIGPDDIDADLIARASVVYTEGYLWDPPDAKKAITKAMETARASGGRSSFSLSDPFCVDRHRAEFLELIANHVDVLFANESEIISLYQAESFDEAAERVAGHCEVAALTRGAAGATVISADGRFDVDAVPVDRVVDTTGAGDLFAAGFLHGLTSGRDHETSARFAAMAAAECVSHVGPRPEVSLAELVTRR
jgi:sugar/nucleoside kinase (ribokinase family)